MRAFIATSFPDGAKQELNERVAAIKSKLPSASWVKPETQHLTFAFLGEQEEALVDRLSIDLRTPKFEATLRGSGFFPNPRRARVGWVGLEPEEPFHEIAQAVRDAVTREGVELDRADFRPHLTLMRIRDGWPPASIDLFQKALKDFRSTPFVVDTVTLYSSRLSPTGSIHTPLRRFALA